MSTTDQTTGVEFTLENPLLVIVGIINGRWDIQVSTKDRFPLDGKIYADKVVERLQAISPEFVGFTANWRLRSIKDGPGGPPFVVAPDLHHPVALRYQEYARYQCDYPFTLTAHRDFHVAPDPRSPDSPFGWSVVQESTYDGSHHVVMARAQAALTYQRFYKAMGWINVPGGPPVLVDPDIVTL